MKHMFSRNVPVFVQRLLRAPKPARISASDVYFRRKHVTLKKSTSVLLYTIRQNDFQKYTKILISRDAAT